MEVLNSEQFMELAAILKGTYMSLEEGLEELDVSIRSNYYSQIEEELADTQEIEQCCLCGYWTFSEAFQRNENEELLCPDCAGQRDAGAAWR